MTLEQTLHREGHAVTPMNVQLAMAIRSLAEEPWIAMVVWWLWQDVLATTCHNSLFMMLMDVSESFRLVTLWPTYFLVISCHIRVLSLASLNISHIDAYRKSMNIMQRWSVMALMFKIRRGAQLAQHRAAVTALFKARFQSLQQEQLSLKDQVPAASHFKECYHNPYHQLFSMCYSYAVRICKNCDNSGSCHDLRCLPSGELT